MIRILVALVLACVVAVSIAAAPSQCSNCQVIGWVDIPAENATVSQSGFHLAGWGFECNSGVQIDRVEVFLENPATGYFYPWASSWNAPGDGGAVYWNQYRPDVRNAYLAHCPNVTAYSGWAYYPPNAPPLGTYRIAVNMWLGALYQTRIKTITVVP